MTSQRKEPHLTDLDHAGNERRIPTLSERASPDLFDDREEPAPAGDQSKRKEPTLHENLASTLELDVDASASPSLDDYDFIEELTREDTEQPAAKTRLDAPEAEATISPEQIETLSDRVLDQIAPVLREAVAAAVTELLAKRSHDKD